jgi:hypothetical protein
MEGTNNLVNDRFTVINTLDMSESGCKETFFSCTHLGHQLVCCEVCPKRVSSYIRDTEAFKNLLHIPVLAVLTMETKEGDIDLTEDSVGGRRTTTVIPLPLFVDIDIVCNEAFSREMREHHCPRLKRNLVFV